MSEELLIRHCSPTLAGIKTGNIFNCCISDHNDFKKKIRKFNRTLSIRGLRIIPLRIIGGKAMVYVYRPERLKNDLINPDSVEILKNYGYNAYDPQHCIIKLIEKLRFDNNFPHEIGLFLGYPPEDVRGFICEGASSCKCVGCWKVYGDVENAKKIFAKYKKCSQIYYSKWCSGRSIEQLTVPNLNHSDK